MEFSQKENFKMLSNALFEFLLYQNTRWYLKNEDQYKTCLHYLIA